MKHFLAFICLLSTSLSAQAQLQSFKKQDALQVVLKSPQVLSIITPKTADIASSHNSTYNSMYSSVISSGGILNQKFIVRLGVENQDREHKMRSCYNDIHVDSIVKAIKNSKGELVTKNELVIKKISNKVCKNSLALAAGVQQ
ncbi:hypothetical protein [Pseudobdellovibrio exovorus]|uniref:Uncharacterized protein n=1 Tax=Pseudobdellovibrio exovorus JSS TaxID=1184267 RepID=M4VB04_9BACT|nr:hypothetical protein [Pseudobdellovibrio exovorus]AGH95655.1 hypothetical protein A11Q_1439 [Pseudobdellovibrio exovorus JSS]